MITLLVLMVFYSNGSFKAALLQVPQGQCETMGKEAQSHIVGETIKDVQFKCVETDARERS